MAINDITGKAFGRLTVIKDSGKRTKKPNGNKGNVLWECRCTCGNITCTTSHKLRSGHTQSCGCLAKEELSRRRKIDLTGKRFGRLIVLKESLEKEKRDQSIYWECRCDCGALCNVRAGSLTHRVTKSCGCLQLDNLKARMRTPGYHKKTIDAKKGKDLVERTSLSALCAKRSKNNTSGVNGVSRDKRSKRWYAYITFKTKRMYLGSFVNKQDAMNARKAAEEKYFEPVLEKYGRKLEV